MVADESEPSSSSVRYDDSNGSGNSIVFNGSGDRLGESSLRVGQETAANLMSIEASFVPASPPLAGDRINQQQQRVTSGVDKRRLERLRRQNGAYDDDHDGHAAQDESLGLPPAAVAAMHLKNSLVRDAAGFIRQPDRGQTGVFGRDTGIAHASGDLSSASRRHNTNGEDYDEDEDVSQQGDPSLPSFEKSASQPAQQPLTAIRNPNMVNGRPPSRAYSSTAASSSGTTTAVASSSKTGAPQKQNLTLREQEKMIETMGKENFDLKMRVHFLQERLAQLAPDSVDAALKENVDMRVRIQVLLQENKGLRKDVKKHAKLLGEAQNALEALQENQIRSSRNDQEANAQIEQLSDELQQEREAAEMLMNQRDELQDRLDDVSSKNNAKAEEMQDRKESLQQLETVSLEPRAQ